MRKLFEDSIDQVDILITKVKAEMFYERKEMVQKNENTFNQFKIASSKFFSECD